MRAGARKRDGLASGTTAPLRVAALIRCFAPPSPTQERGRRGNLRRKLAPMGLRRDDEIIFAFRPIRRAASPPPLDARDARTLLLSDQNSCPRIAPPGKSVVWTFT